MKKLIALGTVAAVSLVTVGFGASAAFAAPSSLTSISYSPNTGTLSTPIEEIINGGLGSANLTGCMVKLADGVEVITVDMVDQTASSSFNTPDGFGFTTAPSSGTIVYTTNFYNDIDCASVQPSDVPTSASFTMLADATYSFTTPTVSMTQGFTYTNRPIPFTTNGNFNWTAGGQFTVSSSSPNPLPAGLTFSGSSVSSQPGLTISGSPTGTGLIPVDFVLSDNEGNSAVATLTFNISAAPVYNAFINSNVVLTEGDSLSTNPITITTSGFNWDNGGIISLDTTTAGCDALPAWASFTGDFWDGTGIPTFSAAGVQPAVSLVGAPPVGSVGTTNLCLLVEDQNGGNAVATFSLIVNAATPVVTPTVSVSVSSLAGVVGTTVNDTVTLTTAGDFDWTNSGTVVTVTGLPAGITATPVLTGNEPTSIVFGGTPTTVENASVTVTVTDALGGTASTSFTFDVTAAPVPTPADTTVEKLVYTGANVFSALATGALLLVAGFVVMFLARARKAQN